MSRQADVPCCPASRRCCCRPQVVDLNMVYIVLCTCQPPMKYQVPTRQLAQQPLSSQPAAGDKQCSICFNGNWKLSRHRTVATWGTRSPPRTSINQPASSSQHGTSPCMQTLQAFISGSIRHQRQMCKFSAWCTYCCEPFKKQIRYARLCTRWQRLDCSTANEKA